MSRCLLAGLAWLPLPVPAQDTGGPFTGTVAIGRETSGACIDNRGQRIPEGMLFEPGPDECQVCTCLRQLPVLCRTVLCAPPQGCRSLRVGDACCEWVCDQWEGAEGGVSELGLRLVASAVTAILSLSLLFFLIYRLRQRKLRGRQNHLEAESFRREESRAEEFPGRLGSFQLDNLKPHDRILLRRPFPPSYSEAVSGGLEPGAAPPYSAIHGDPVLAGAAAAIPRTAVRVLPATALPATALPATALPEPELAPHSPHPTHEYSEELTQTAV